MTGRFYAPASIGALVLCAATMFAGPAQAIRLAPAAKAATDSAIAAMMTGRFSRAFAVVDSQGNADPLAPVLKLFVIAMRELDFERTLDSTGFEQSYKTALGEIDKYEKSHGRSSYTLTLSGYARATYASYNLRKKRYGAAVKIGLNALDLLKQSKQLDSADHDADFFLGLYEYARGELKKRLWWVLFWYGGDKEHGIELLEACGHADGISAVAARLALSDIYIQAGSFEKALGILDGLDAAFAGSRFVDWQRVNYLEARKDYRRAAVVCTRLRRSYRDTPEGGYNALATGYRAAQNLKRDGQSGAAFDLCRTLLSECAPTPPGAEELCREIRRLMEKVAQND